MRSRAIGAWATWPGDSRRSISWAAAGSLWVLSLLSLSEVIDFRSQPRDLLLIATPDLVVLEFEIDECLSDAIHFFNLKAHCL